MELTNADIKSAQNVFDAYLEYRKSDEEHVSYTQWFKKIRHSYPDARQSKGSAEQQTQPAISLAIEFIQSRPCSSLDIYTVQDFIKWLREKQQAGA